MRTLLRVLLWEICRLRNVGAELSFDGSRFDVGCRDGIGRLLYYFGEVDREIFDFLDGYLKPGSVVVDVGANVGVYSRFAASRVGPTGSVFCFEPNPKLLPRLRKNLSPLPVQIFPYAVGDRAGIAKLYIMNDTAKSSLVSTGNPDRTLEVPCITLDEFHAQTMKTTVIDYLKVDVEGFDYHVLIGGEKLFRNQMVKLLQIEITQDQRETRSFLADNGYALCRVLPTGALSPVRNDEPLPHNLFAHPDDFLSAGLLSGRQ